MALSFLGSGENRVNGAPNNGPNDGGGRRGGPGEGWLRPFDLNTADEASLAELQNIGPERAHILVENRPYRNWREVEKLPGFGPELVDILAQAGVQIGQVADSG